MRREQKDALLQRAIGIMQTYIIKDNAKQLEEHAFDICITFFPKAKKKFINAFIEYCMELHNLYIVKQDMQKQLRVYDSRKDKKQPITESKRQIYIGIKFIN